MAAGEKELTAEGKDKLAQIVGERLRRAYDRQHDYVQHEGKSVWAARYRALKQYNREYTSEDAHDIERAFGFVPTRYYGVVQQKTNATVNWCTDLVLAQLDAMATCVPTPEPTIDKPTLDRIRFFLEQEIYEYAQNSGLADLSLLVNGAGKLDDRVKYFLEERANALKKAEQAKIVTTASAAADRMQIRMRDLSVEGGFAQAYIGMKSDQALYGMGYMRFPVWRARPHVEFTPSGGVKRTFVTKPTFRHVSVHDFYPIDDGEDGDLQTNTGNTEVTYITKARLIQCAKTDGYDKKVIQDILEEYAYHDRDWVWTVGGSTDRNEEITYWDLDEKIPLLIHEGFFSGNELKEHGITGVDTLDYLNARVEICGGRTIRCQLIKAPQGESRTYFGAPFIKSGASHFDYVGLAGMLWDTEQRVNRLLHCFEHNVDWSSRPPVLYNPSTFSDPADARNLQPGYSYGVEERFGVTGSMPDAIRTMNTVTAQYHLIMTQIQTLLRLADEDCGIPAFAYGAQDMGRSSLGEYTQRMTNALRTIKGMAINEDLYLIRPMFQGMFEHIMTTEPELREGQDIDLQIRGITGLLKEDMQAEKQQQILPTLLGARAQGVPDLDKAIDFSVRMLLQQAGFPVDALGMTDPYIENALAVAANQPLRGVNPSGAQAPTLDGRSGPIPGANVTQAGGIMPNYNLAQTGPM